MTEKQKMLAGIHYDASDAELVRLRSRARSLSQAYNQTLEEQTGKRKSLMHEILGSVGEGSEINPTVNFDYGCNTYIGENCYFNFNTIFLDCAEIRFGDNVLVGPNVSFLTPLHPLLARERNMRIAPDGHRYTIEACKPITIEDNVWIGGNVTVTPGVTIGHNTVIGAGSVVTKDIPPGVIAVGNPCRVLRAITEDDALGV